LRGEPDDFGFPEENVFTVCNAEGDQDDELRDLLEEEFLPEPEQEIPPDVVNEVVEDFEECLFSAALNPGTGDSELQAQALSLQEDSLTTNVKPEAGISTFSAPTIAQGTEEDLSALEKTTKLKQQWLDLLP
jgi:hypothetical protein